jgi:hypothetical protein
MNGGWRGAVPRMIGLLSSFVVPDANRWFDGRPGAKLAITSFRQKPGTGPACDAAQFSVRKVE